MIESDMGAGPGFRSAKLKHSGAESRRALILGGGVQEFLRFCITIMYSADSGFSDPHLKLYFSCVHT